MMLQSPQAAIMSPPSAPAGEGQPWLTRRKRKAETQDSYNNERLSKRLSLLNLEHSGTKLYVPVENPRVQLQQVQSTSPTPTTTLSTSTSTSTSTTTPFRNPPSSTSTSSTAAVTPGAPPAQDDSMQLDDTKYKVYIYNLDDELSSESDAEDGNEARNGKLVFLPDIEKHLRASRISIPPPILPNKEGELAGMQLVLYSDPSSLSVPREHDSVRKAVIEARARLRERQREEREEREAREQGRGGLEEEAMAVEPIPAAGVTIQQQQQQQPQQQPSAPPQPAVPIATIPSLGQPSWPSQAQDDSDAMDID